VTTGGDGQASLTWQVQVNSVRNNVKATVTVFALDNTGKQANAQKTVTVNTR
jgi:hypothetical protein